MAKVYNNIITTTAGFNYPAQQPLDDREVVQSYADLAQLVSSNVAYEGLEVYVVDDKKSYKLIAGEWKAIATEEYVNANGANIDTSNFITKDKIGENLNIDENGIISVSTTSDLTGDKTRPMTASGVETIIGNIDILLETI